MDTFYDDERARKLFRDFISRIVLRKNSVNGKLYR
jgi:hypothetical protein